MSVDLRAELLQCVRCATCREVCPTYLTLGREAATPRGRIALMLAENDGKIVLDAAFAAEMDLCLGCRACEAACPSAVPYGHLLEHTRHKIEAALPRPGWQRALRRFLFATVLPSRRWLGVIAAALRFYQRSGLQRLVRVSGLLKLLPGRLRVLGTMEARAPDVPPADPLAYAPRAAVGEERARVAFLAGCVAPVFLPGPNRATIGLLARQGCRVEVPAGQTCCGALHAHAGELELARNLAKQNIAAFETTGVDAVTTNSAGCGAMMKEYGQLLADDPEWADRAARFSARVKDVSEFLAGLGWRRPAGAAPGEPGNAAAAVPVAATAPRLRVAFQDACHLGNAQGVKVQPRQFLRQIPGAEVVDIRDTEVCCGAAGIYNMVHADVAQQLLDRKLDAILETGASVVATTNPGCYLHLSSGIRQRGLQGKLRVAHVTELLEEATR